MKYLKMILIYIGSILLFSLVTSILFYFNIINDKTLNVLNIIGFIIVTFISSFYLAKRSKNKSIIESLIISGIYILISLFFVLILPNRFNISYLYSYITIFITSLIANKLSINYKIKDKNYEVNPK